MYTQSITRNHRTAFILAIDGSGSMAESILFRGRCMTKAEAVATITNDLLFELVERARRSDGVRDYYDIAVVGYSGDDEVRSLLPGGEDLVPVSALAAQEMPVHTEVIEHRLPDGSIALREIPAPAWIKPLSAGQTPMCEALRRVRDIAASWTSRTANAERNARGLQRGHPRSQGPGCDPALPRHELQRLGGPAGRHAQHRFHQRQNRIEMIVTLQHFSRALLTPDLSLAMLADARPVTEPNGMPRLVRTTRFAEAEVEWRGERWLVAMPLNPSAMPRIERTVSALRKLNTGYLAECRILPGEMRWHDAAGTERHTDLVLQHLPAGREFAEALLAEDKTTLLAALDALQAALGELEFTHNNLKEANLRWHRGRFVPIRYYDARIGAAEPGTADREAFDVLRHRIAEAPVPRQTANDVTVPYNPLRSLTGHRWTSHVFEGLVCVEDDNGFGFVDTDNNPVIPAQFVWAGDFREGRAEVQTQTGMGLIDRRGCYVIPPEYEIVDYDPAASVVHVRNNGHWALFDYLGRRLTEFRTEVPEPCGPEICR